MKKLLLLFIALIFLAVSCSSSKKAGNDADILPDEDIPDYDKESSEKYDDDETEEDDEYSETGEENPCTKFANSSGEYIYSGNGKHCGCLEGYFWAKPGCKKKTYANICTGQRICYDCCDGMLDCPKEGESYFGQDAYYAGLGYCKKSSFTVNHPKEEATLTDNNLMIEWMKIDWKQEGTDDKYTWTEAIDYCENLEYAGHSDWRLPEPNELLFLDFSLSTSFPSPYTLWSGTQMAGDAFKAWVLYIDDEDGGILRTFSKTSSYNVRCVREKAPSAPVFKVFEINGDEIVRDLDSGLAWTKTPERVTSWKDALAYCEDLEYAGFSDWRVPNRNELLSLVDYGKSYPASAFPDAEKNFSSEFITSTTDPGPVYSKSFVTISFDEGRIESELKTQDTGFYSRLLCVRNEPCKENYWWNGEKCLKDLCKKNSCKDDEHSTGVCNLIDFKESVCECNDNYFWNVEKCVSPCDPNPCAEDSNSNEVCVAQDTKKYYCGCADDYFWNGEKCVSPCDPNPCGKDKNSTGECTVSTIDLYDCGCKDGYFFDGEKCVNPCTDVSCGQFEHATGECKGESAFAYSCTCDSGYFWRGKDKGCTATKPYAVNVCTGQNKCYDNEKEITCPAEGEEFFGQDAQFARLGICIPQSYSIDYSIESEPVVVDNNTGMMWQRNIPPVETLYSSQASAYCSNLVYGGYDDWSLPSITAFITITDFGRYNPAIDTKYFPDSGKFWTSSMSSETFGGDPIENHGYYTIYYYNSIFDFTDPFVSSVRTYEYDNYSMISGTNYAYSFNIRCVRGPGIGSSTFISKTFGNNLMWNYSNDTIFVKKAGANHTWQEALKYCSELDYAGFSDWRLPNIRELYLTGHTGVHSSTTRAGAPNSDYSGTASKTTVKNDTFCITNDPCEDGKFWNGEKCAKNPCIGNPCKEIAYSSRECQVVDEETFDCGCDSYYFWNSDQKKCLRSCKGNPCSSYQHSDKKCYEDKEIGFYCGCETPYQWNPDKRKCMMNCDTNPCAEIEHGSHECFEDENEGYKCGCVEGHVWIGNSCREDLCNPNPCEEKPYSNGVCTLKYNSDASNGYYYSCGCIEGYKWQGDNVKDCVPK